MKWLILLVLISCGKHEQPAGKDIRDSDGDQVLNFQEGELEKYVAQIEPLGTIKGNIRFIDDKIFSLPFTNNIDLKKKSFDLMVASDRKVEQEDFFAEWSKVRIDPIPLNSLRKNEYQVFVKFETASNNPDEVVLIEEEKTHSLGKWVPEMQLFLSVERLKDLISGKSYLSLKKNFKKTPQFNGAADETIRKNTYRVHYFDGTGTKVLYVAKALTFIEFQKQMGVEVSQPMEIDDFFFNSRFPLENQWYSRELMNGDKVLVFTDINSLSESFKNKFHYQKKVVSRVNGSPQSSLNLANKAGARIYLRINSLHRTERTFSESKHDRRYGREGGGREGGASSARCAVYHRNIVAEKTLLLSLENLLANIQQPEVLTTSEMIEDMDDKGIFWEMKIDSVRDNLALALNARPSSTYTVTGEYASDCPMKRAPSYSTNTEGKMAFEVESFVEKMD